MTSSPSTTSPIIRCSPRLQERSKSGHVESPPNSITIVRRSPRNQNKTTPSSPRKCLVVHRHHNRIAPNPYLKIDSLKAVYVRIGNDRGRIPVRKRVGHLKKWHHDVLEKSAKYRRSFRKLKLADRKEELSLSQNH